MATVTQKQEYDLAQLVREHQAGIWRYIRFLGAATGEADDLVQETFLACMRSRFTYRDSASTASYLRQVARNQLLQLRRRQGREVNTVQLEAAESVWAEVAAEDGLSDYLSALRSCISQLRDRSRQVVALRYEQGLSREEVALRLDMTSQGVKTLLRRTRQLLRQCVQRKVIEDE